MLLVAAIMLGLMLAFPLPKAFASPEDENLVDPTQRADNSFIYDTDIKSLFDEGALHDGKTVQIVGEVIGDRIFSPAEGFSWVTLTVLNVEDKTSISIFISDEQAAQIDSYGKYGVTGTVLQVRGTFNQACVEHDGLSDVHVTDSSVMSRGAEHPDAFNANDFIPGLITLLVGVALMVFFYAARERTR